MGIKGIYNEIGSGQRIALSKLAIETLEQQGRPLRLAIDISIWLFQIQSGKGGTNPALRTFYYRLLRLISLSIHPLFVFDGPNKPPFKRGKRTGPNVASIPDFLAKQLLKQFALPFHIAPGEAEAECALLQREGIVDAVLSEDVDTLMLGSGLTMRNWSPEGTLKTRTFTHVNLYDAKKTKETAGLDREGMILVALMSGGDYIPEGIPGCGPKTGCEAAKAGFGKDLCNIPRHNTSAIAEWKTRLMHELRTNESKFFRSKHKALVIPVDFPRQDVLRYYTHPCVSPSEKIESLRRTVKWDQNIDLIGLRTFASEAFDWVCVSGAKKFIRNLAPALLAKELRLNASDDRPVSDDTYDVATKEARLLRTIHLKRQHISTDNMTELRIGFLPINLVPIDLSAEDPDPELPLDEESEGEEADPGADGDGGDETVKKRGPLLYDPTTLEKIWMPETLVKLGVPLKLQDWEESFRDARKFNTMKGMTKRTEKALKSRGGMQQGALDRFAKVSKPGLHRSASVPKDQNTQGDQQAAVRSSEPPTTSTQQNEQPNPCSQEQPNVQGAKRPAFRIPPVLPPTPPRPVPSIVTVNLLSSPDTQPEANTAKRKRILRRSQSDTSHLSKIPLVGRSTSPQLSAPQAARSKTPEQQDLEPIAELPSSITIRRHRSPLRRTQSISSTTSTNMHQTTLFDPKRPIFQKPPILSTSPPRPQPAPSQRPLPASEPITTTAPTKQPSTPKKSKPSTVITISSSPAGTPSSAQRSITAYLSPNRQPPPHSPGRSRPPHPFPNLALSSTATTTNTDKPAFRRPLSLTSATTLNASSSTSTPVDATNDVSPPAKPQRPSSAASHTTSFIVPPLPHGLSGTRRDVVSSGERIRLRESLNGAWAVEPVPMVADARPGEAGAGSDGDGGRKRKRKVGGVGGWRLSQVGVVDLT